jgi:hypothetical protein
MKYRKLRIAWTLVWGVLAILLCVLWIRSYWLNDNLSIGAGRPLASFRPYVTFVSNWGFIQIMESRILDNGAWIYSNQPAWERTDVGFEWRDDGAIKIPDIFLLVVAVAAGMAPWLNYKRFSLRTLLIATTLVAVVLGLIAWAVR